MLSYHQSININKNKYTMTEWYLGKIYKTQFNNIDSLFLSLICYDRKFQAKQRPFIRHNNSSI